MLIYSTLINIKCLMMAQKIQNVEIKNRSLHVVEEKDLKRKK